MRQEIAGGSEESSGLFRPDEPTIRDQAHGRRSPRVASRKDIETSDVPQEGSRGITTPGRARISDGSDGRSRLRSLLKHYSPFRSFPIARSAWMALTPNEEREEKTTWADHMADNRPNRPLGTDFMESDRSSCRRRLGRLFGLAHDRCLEPTWSSLCADTPDFPSPTSGSAIPMASVKDHGSIPWASVPPASRRLSP